MFYITGKNEYLALITKADSFRISINIKKEPYSFNVHKFEFNNFNDIVCDDNKIYIAKHNEIITLNTNFDKIKSDKTENGLTKMVKFGNHFIIITAINSNNYFKVTDENLIPLFIIPICSDMIDNLFLKDSKVYFSSMEKLIYTVNINNELALYRNRLLMKEEDRQSMQYMSILAKESKKKSKGKGGKKSKPGTANTMRSKSVASKLEPSVKSSKPSSAVSNNIKSKPSTAKSRISESVKSAKSGNTIKSVAESSNVEEIKENIKKKIPKAKKTKKK